MGAALTAPAPAERRAAANGSPRDRTSRAAKIFTGTSALHWHAEAMLLGVRMQAHFFDPEQVNLRVTFVERFLPVFRQARPRLLGDGAQRLNYIAGDLCAQPDAVLEHGNGLLCLTYRHTERLQVDRANWATQIRVDAMLQSIASAVSVAGARQLPTAALLRIGNALLLFSPSPPVLECLASNIASARRYWNTPNAVTASQLAGYCEPLLRKLPGIGDALAGTPLPSAGSA